METPKKFRTSLFGYKKKNVNAYIMENAQRFEKTKRELEAKVYDLEAANRELEERNLDMKEKISMLEKERAFIADALLNANQEAEKILACAKSDAARIRSELEIELEGLNGEISREKNRIAEIRNDAKKALGEYISRLDNIDIENGGIKDIVAVEESEEAPAEEAFEKEVEEEIEQEVSAPASEREFEPIIADGDDLMSDLEAINAPAEEVVAEDESEEDAEDEEIEEAYDIETDDDDEGDFEIENIEA